VQAVLDQQLKRDLVELQVLTVTGVNGAHTPLVQRHVVVAVRHEVVHATALLHPVVAPRVLVMENKHDRATVLPAKHLANRRSLVDAEEEVEVQWLFHAPFTLLLVVCV